jgi:hypothetical protein
MYCFIFTGDACQGEALTCSYENDGFIASAVRRCMICIEAPAELHGDA